MVAEKQYYWREREVASTIEWQARGGSAASGNLFSCPSCDKHKASASHLKHE